MKRREFFHLGATATVCTGLAIGDRGAPAGEASANNKPWLRKTLKIGMIAHQGSLEDRFKLAKSAGFEGVELNVPGIDLDQCNDASKASGLIIDGTVGGYHWKERHSDPDPKVREVALKKLLDGIQQTAKVGADTMLLVPAHGKDGSDAEVYERAFAAIQSALPVAEENGVSILIENVWNDFLYEHDGANNQTADSLAKFIDAFHSPWVGVQFDLGNHWKYGDPAAWIRTLDNRIKKLDIKGFSRKKDQFTKITDGDIDWASVRRALRDIGYTGWVAAEVKGGGLDRLVEVNRNMETALHCSESVPIDRGS